MSLVGGEDVFCAHERKARELSSAPIVTLVLGQYLPEGSETNKKDYKNRDCDGKLGLYLCLEL